ncbi:MAG: hypothetical protein QOD03_1262 [Verrucomicrobiota bacterium]
MDWSLALVSQGIESTIDFSEEGGWGLIVSEPEYEHAVRTIEQYHRENRHWPWQRKISSQGILFDWSSLAWVFLIALFFWLSGEYPQMRDAGIMDGAAVSRGEWWRLFTAIFLHADIGHFAANATIGLVLLGLTMGHYGTGVGILAAYLAGAGGNVTTWLVFENHHSLGASGMVMGCVGLLAAQSVSFSRHPQAWKYAVGGLIGGTMLFILMGLSPGTDVLAHLGGFASGVLLGILLTLATRLLQNNAANVSAGLLFCGSVILTWWLALSGGK